MKTKTKTKTKTTTTAITTAGLCLLLAACSSGATTPASDAASTAPAGAATSQAATLTVTDAWAKAAPASGAAMTGVFGTIRNTTPSPVTITGATSTAAGVVELHETKDGAMQKIDGGMEIPANGTRELRPGGDHIMLMQLKQPLPVGQAVTILLTTSTGATVEFQAVAKTFTGGDEKYHSGSPSAGGSSGTMPSTPGTGSMPATLSTLSSPADS